MIQASGFGSRFLCGFLTLLSAAGAFAGEFSTWYEHPFDGEHYQQTEFKKVDPKGDALLIRHLRDVPRRLWVDIQKEHAKRVTNPNRSSMISQAPSPKPSPEKKYVIGRVPPIKVDALLNKVRQMIQDFFPITPFISEEHEWSEEAKSYVGGGIDLFGAPFTDQSRLFYMLACGWTAKYAITGKETELEEILMKYPDRGVQIHDVFRESYVLHRGDLYLSLLTAENILAKNPYNKDRAKVPLQKKLAYIRNDSLPIGDNYGPWYHFYGIALYGLMRTAPVTAFVGRIEHLGSWGLGNRDKQKGLINDLGASFGSGLRKMIEDRKYLLPLSPEDSTDYMNLVETGFDPGEKWKSSSPRALEETQAP